MSLTSFSPHSHALTQLSAKLWSPFRFLRAIVAFDFVLRILVLEKHEVQRYKRPPKLDTRRETVVSLNVVSPTKEALLSDRSHSLISPISPSFPKEDAHERAAGEISVDMNTDVMPDPTERAMAAAAESIKEESEERVSYNHWLAIAYLLFNMKALTPLLISFVNGFLFSGIYNTALVLRLNQRYGLDSTKAGLVFLAVAGPSAIVSPLSVSGCTLDVALPSSFRTAPEPPTLPEWLICSCDGSEQGRLTDRYGPRPLSMLCCGGFVPVLCLLMIDQLPLAAFIVLLVFTGICSGLINSVSLCHASPSNSVHCPSTWILIHTPSLLLAVCSPSWSSWPSWRTNRTAASALRTSTAASTAPSVSPAFSDQSSLGRSWRSWASPQASRCSSASLLPWPWRACL